MQNNYEQKATDFLTKNNITIDITFKKNDFHFNGDEQKRDIYNITIKKGNRSMSFDYGNSLNNSGFKVKTPPTAYDVLSCLTYNDPGTFEDFCLEFDYNNDSIKHLELYKRVVKEYQQVLTIFNDQEIQEIQDFL